MRTVISVLAEVTELLILGLGAAAMILAAWKTS